jgi:drug/metabolite transporter (DMT)-like permease
VAEANRQRVAAQRTGGLAAVNVAAVIFGATALFGKLHVSPVWIVAGRCAFAALTLAVIAVLRRTKPTTRIPILGTVVTGALIAVHWIAFFVSVQLAGVAVATLTAATFPLFTSLIEAARHRRRPRTVELASGLIIIAAVALISGAGLPKTLTAQLGMAAGFAAAVIFAVFAILSQKLNADGDPVSLSMRQQAFAALLLAPFLPFVSPTPASANDWLLIAALGVVATALAHQLYFFALRRLPAAVCGSFVSLEPVYAIAMAAVLFGEPIGLVVVVSGVMIVGASSLLLWRSGAVVPD